MLGVIASESNMTLNSSWKFECCGVEVLGLEDLPLKSAGNFLGASKHFEIKQGSIAPSAHLDHPQNALRK